MAPLSIGSRLPLSNGRTIPILGLGTWQMDDETAEVACRTAIEAGYRHLDTATFYGNERGVGRAIRHCGLRREDLFVTTKLWPTDFFDPEKAFQKNLERLELEYVDLYLVHWPVPMQPKSVYRALEKIYERKEALAIGVSNYSIENIEKALSYANVPPMVDQVRFNPFDYKKDLLEYCKKKNIVLTSYSPLNRGKSLEHPALAALAKKHGKSPPRSASAGRCKKAPWSSRSPRIRTASAKTPTCSIFN